MIRTAILLTAVLLASGAARAQTGSTTTTSPMCTSDSSGSTCTVISPAGKYTSIRCTGSPQNPTCTSTIVYDPGATSSSPAVNNAQMYESGKALGDAAGSVIGKIMVHKFCKKHPGATWHSGNGMSGTCR